MKVLLLKDVPGLGQKNDIKDVNDGYARNFLFARKFAVMATNETIQEVEKGKKHKEQKQQDNQKKYQDIAQQLEKIEVVITTKVGEKGKAFGSVGRHDIKKSLDAQGYMIEEEWIALEEPIKTTGTTRVPLKFPHGVMGSIAVIIRPE